MGEPLPEWLAQFPVSVGDTVTSECVGVTTGAGTMKKASTASNAAKKLFGSLVPTTLKTQWQTAKTQLQTAKSTMSTGLKASLGPQVEGFTRLAGIGHCALGQASKTYHRTA